MEKLIIIFGLLTASAMGQSTIPNQKACYDQAVKMAKENNAVTFKNRYDSKTDTCWLRLDLSTTDASTGTDNNFITVGDAFQRQWTATFTGPQYTGRTPLNECNVDGVKCRDINEFLELVKKRYGL